MKEPDTIKSKEVKLFNNKMMYSIIEKENGKIQVLLISSGHDIRIHSNINSNNRKD